MKNIHEDCYSLEDREDLYQLTKPKCFLIDDLKTLIIRDGKVIDSWKLERVKYIMDHLNFYPDFEREKYKYRAMVVGEYVAELAGASKKSKLIDVWIFEDDSTSADWYMVNYLMGLEEFLGQNAVIRYMEPTAVRVILGGIRFSVKQMKTFRGYYRRCICDRHLYGSFFQHTIHPSLHYRLVVQRKGRRTLVVPIFIGQPYKHRDYGDYVYDFYFSQNMEWNINPPSLFHSCLRGVAMSGEILD